MTVLVSDVSVLIDLEHGSLLEAAFQMPFEFAVPDVLYELELKAYNGPALLELGLTVAKMDGDGTARGINYRRQKPALSLPDAFALALAATNRWKLLTGDRALRTLAVEEGIECHGVLWLLDRIFEAGVANPDVLCAGLRAIQAHPRCRLPKKEIAKRIARWT